MTGEFNFAKFATFLRSFWGILASMTVVLPTIIYFLNASQVKSSILADFYIGIPTTFALLTIPFVFLFEDKLSFLNSARKLALAFSLLSFITLFSFLFVKNFYMGDKKYIQTAKNGYDRIEISETSDGQILIQTYDSIKAVPIKEEKRTNGLELLCLLLYTLNIIFLTAAFSGLGVFFYSKTKGSVSAESPPLDLA